MAHHTLDFRSPASSHTSPHPHTTSLHTTPPHIPPHHTYPLHSASPSTQALASPWGTGGGSTVTSLQSLTTTTFLFITRLPAHSHPRPSSCVRPIFPSSQSLGSAAARGRTHDISKRDKERERELLMYLNLASCVFRRYFVVSIIPYFPLKMSGSLLWFLTSSCLLSLSPSLSFSPARTHCSTTMQPQRHHRPQLCIGATHVHYLTCPSRGGALLWLGE